MQKKIICLLLSAILLLAAAGPVFAAEADAPALTEQDRALADELAALRVPVEPIGNVEENTLLDAGGGTVNVTVSLPGGVSAKGGVYVYLTKAPVKDAKGKVTKEPDTVRGDYINFSGKSSESVTFTNVEDGDYLIGIYSYPLNAPGMICDWATYYYNADGSAAADAYTAKPFHISGGSVNKSVTLRKAERTISGTLHFSKPLENETSIQINAYPQSSGNSDYQRGMTTLTLAKGTTSANFSIPVGKGSMTVYFYGASNLYLQTDGTLSGSWNTVAYIDTWGGDVTGLAVQGDALVGGGTSGTAQVTITMTLPRPVTSDRMFLVYFQSQNSGDTTSFHIKKGETSGSVTVSLQKNVGYTFCCMDWTDMSNGNIPAEDAIYLAQNGFTSKQEQAKSFTFTGDGTVNFNESTHYAITGTVSRGDYLAGERAAAYVGAKFPDSGEYYAARVFFDKNEKSGAYTIFVPRSENGKSFQLTGVLAQDGAGSRAIESTRTAPVTLTLNGDTAGGNITVTMLSHTVSGTVTLPAGAAIPAAGATLSISGGSETAHFVIPAGTTSYSYSFEDSGETTRFTATLSNVSGLLSEVSADGSFNGSGNISGLNFIFEKSAVISGSILLPAGVNDVGVSLSLNGGSNSGGGYAYSSASVLKGKTKGAYHIEVPIGSEMRVGASVQSQTVKRIKQTSYYLNNEGKFEPQYFGDLTVTGNMSGVDIQLEPITVLFGTPNTLTAGTYTFTYSFPGAKRIVFQYGGGDGSNSLHYVYFNGSTEQSGDQTIYNSGNLYVNGDSVTFTYTVTNPSFDPGFYVSGITVYDNKYQEITTPTEPVVAGVYAEGTNQVGALRSGAGVDAVVVGAAAGDKVVAALYDENGMLLDYAEGTKAAEVGIQSRWRFDLGASSAMNCKVFLVGSTWTPKAGAGALPAA